MTGGAFQDTMSKQAFPKASSEEHHFYKLLAVCYCLKGPIVK